MILISQKTRIRNVIVFLSLTTIYNESNAAEAMRNITSMQIVQDMKVGWNLGNTLDAWANGTTGLNTETCWGNPKTTK
ncbi:MAG TPA: hypothetical protein VHO70_10850, partial [Chitinispirillaceae bacterium]|nr:hypothetical protein [Chitinispirillaceae bacterium]